MTEMMTAVAVTKAEKFSIVKIPVPAVSPAHVLVKVAYCGICGSDIPRYFAGAVHAFPQVLGHEFSGVVVALGDGVEGILVGDHVTVAPHVPCGRCEQCMAGNPTLCSNYSFIGSREQGAMAEYVVAPAANVIHVGDLGLRAAALVEPLTVAVHAVNRVKIDSSLPIAILGCGVIGLMTMLSLQGCGANDITAVDINPWNLKFADRMGAKHTINTLGEDIEARFDGNRPVVVFDTAGVPATIRQALQIAAHTGSVVYVGKPTKPVEVAVETFEKILRKELKIYGSWLSYSSPFPGYEWSEAIRLLLNAPLDPAEIVTHEYELDDAAEGFQIMRNSDVHRLKVMFRVGGEES